MVLPSLPYTLLQAIARQEGFYSDAIPETRPQRLNNPGDLEFSPWMTNFGGQNDQDPRFAWFPSPDAGFSALRHLLQFPLYKGKTISQAISIFAPSTENNVRSYVNNVCSWCEATPDTVIDTILG